MMPLMWKTKGPCGGGWTCRIRAANPQSSCPACCAESWGERTPLELRMGHHNVGQMRGTARLIRPSRSKDQGSANYPSAHAPWLSTNRDTISECLLWNSCVCGKSPVVLAIGNALRFSLLVPPPGAAFLPSCAWRIGVQGWKQTRHPIACDAHRRRDCWCRHVSLEQARFARQSWSLPHDSWKRPRCHFQVPRLWLEVHRLSLSRQPWTRHGVS